MWIAILLLLSILVVKFNKQITNWANDNIEKLNVSDRTEDSTEDLEQLEYKSYIERKAQNIRMVVVIYVDSIKEPWPYKLKKQLPLLKKNHKEVLNFFNSPHYSEITKEAEFDLFYGDFRIPGNKTRYKKFFAEYIHQPHSLNLHNIKKQMPDSYLEDFDESLFCV